MITKLSKKMRAVQSFCLSNYWKKQNILLKFKQIPHQNMNSNIFYSQYITKKYISKNSSTQSLAIQKNFNAFNNINQNICFSLLQNKMLTYFSSQQKEKSQSHQNSKQNHKLLLQKDLQIIITQKLFQDPIKLTAFLLNKKKQYTLKQKIQFYKKLIELLRQKNIWKNHIYPYMMVLMYLFHQNQKHPQIENYIQQIDQLLKLYQNYPNYKPNIKLITNLLGMYSLIKNNKEKGQFYLDKAYPNNQVQKYDQFSALLLAVKMDNKKFQQAQKIANSFINLLQKSDTFNKAFSKILLTKWQLKKDVLSNQIFFIKQDQQQEYYKKSTQICQNLVEQNNKYMKKWQELIYNQQKQCYSKIHKKQKLSSEENSFLMFRLQMASSMFLATRFLMSLLFRKGKYDEILKMYQTEKQKYSILYQLSELGKIFLIVSKCYKHKQQKKKALDLANQAKSLFFANPVQVTSDLLLDCYLDIIFLSNQLGQQQVQKINVQQMSQKLSALSKDSNTFYYEYMFRKQVCYLYLVRKDNQKLQKQTQKLQNRLNQFRKLLSHQRISQILVRVNYFKAITLFGKQQYGLSKQCIIMGQNLIKQNKFQQPQLLQKLDKLKKYCQNYLSGSNTTEAQIKETRRKNLQHFKNTFTYQNFFQSKISKSQFEIQCKKIQQAVRYALSEAIKENDSQEKTLIYSVLDKIFQQSQKLFNLAKESKINKIFLKGEQIKLQHFKLTYLYLLNTQNLNQEGIANLIDRVKTVINELNIIIQDCYDQNRKQNWMKLRQNFQQAENIFTKQKMVIHQINFRKNKANE